MRTQAFWLPEQEYVEVDLSVGNHSLIKHKEPAIYPARRIDGTAVMIRRKDLIFQDEEALIRELANIVMQRKFSADQGRYADIMRYLLRNGVPFSAMLESLISKRAEQQTMDFGKPLVI